jgi:SAM-dependent methyltransferase
MMAGFDPATLAFYADQTEMYLGCRPDHVNSEVSDFLALLAPKARILELGCGGGADAEYMISQGFNVEPTDGVAEMAARAEARLGTPVRVMRFDMLEAVEEYDAVIASASLLHVPLADLAGILARIWRALKPGGLHLATYKTDALASRDEHGRYYNFLTREEAETNYRAAGKWDAIRYEEAQGVGYFSKPALWLKIIAKKAEIDNLAKSD